MTIQASSFLSDGYSGLAETLSDRLSYDPTLATCDPAEASIRNQLSFANIRVSFPTTEPSLLGMTNFIAAPALSLPAYVTAFKDDYKPNFTQETVYGRTDPIPRYTNTTRNINVSLLIPCYDRVDANENLKKLNTFIKNLYPTYNSIKGDLVLAAPPLVRVKFGNLMLNMANQWQGLLGYITTFSWEMDWKDGVYMDNGDELVQNLYFRSYKLSFTMGVLHERVIGFKNGGFNEKNDFPYRTRNTLTNKTDIQSYGQTQDNISRDVSKATILGDV
tara:strand:- start:13820 stop:14644 length:825 start_codon:yes stop_codon:yes gene_type:complete